MKPRLPTAEEKRQWRESNRFTQVKEGLVEDPVVEDAPKSTDKGKAEVGVPVAAPASAAKPKALTPLALLTQREGNRTLKSAPPVEATLDLHGLTKLEAHARVEAFITRQSRAGKRHVAIITGKGRDGVGVLRTHVPQWLNEVPLRPLISALAHARPEKGGAGVLHVLLKRRHD